MGDTIARRASTAGTVSVLRVLLVASIVVPSLLLAAAAWQDRRVLLEEAERRVEKTVAILEQHATAAFHTYELVFARIDEHLRVAAGRETEDELHAYLAGMDRELNEIGSLFLVDAHGRVTVHSRFDPVPPSSVLERDYYRALVGDDVASRSIVGDTGLAVGAPVSGKFSGTAKLNIARARRSADGSFAGLIAISVSQEYFEAFHGTLSTGGDSIVLARADGAVLARSPTLTERELVGFDQNDRDALSGRFDGGGVKVFTSPINGVERIAAYRRLKGYPIYVGYTIDRDRVLLAWRWDVLLFGAVAALAAATLFGVTFLALRTLTGEMRRRETAEAALRQSQKMEAVGQLTGGIAHDFNNLLAAVLGNLELLAKRLPDDPRLRRYLDGAVDGARRGVGLTQRMLAFARRQELKPENVDVAALISGLSGLLETSLGPTVRLRTQFPPNLPAARVDSNQLETALLNLAVNARDAMPDGGDLLVAGREADAGATGAPALPPGRYVVVSVTDTGAGMDEATLARAAEPFFTTKGVGKGTGLGLAMVHGLAAQSGGTLALASSPGRGTVAELWLPATDERAAVLASTAEAIIPASARSLRVLVVDDAPLVLANTAAFLEDLGHGPVEAPSGTAALAILAEGDRVDAILTDQVMPGMTGSTLRATVAARWPGIPVIIMSGFMELDATGRGASARLVKPFGQAELAAALSEVATPHRQAAPADL